MKKIVVLGSGPGGYSAAFKAARQGFEVCLVESDKIGGTCLNYGCIPTKTLKSSADALETAKRLPEFGIEFEGSVKPNIQAIISRKDKVCGILRTGLEKTAKSLKVEYIKGYASILNPNKIHVQNDTECIEIDCDYIIIATGSSILELPGMEYDHKYIINSDDALELDEIPQSLLIVGGGVIGCEMANIFHTLGSKVTIIEGQDRLLPMPSIDKDISTLLAREMKKRRITCEFNSTLKDLTIKDNKVYAKLAPFNTEISTFEEQEISADMVLITIGRKANTDGIGLEKLNLAIDGRFLAVNEFMQTSVPNIYAIGDVLGPAKIMLAHVATAEGHVAVEHILGNDAKMNYDFVPSAIFTSPEIASVGLSEEQARAIYDDIKTSSLQVRELGKAQAMSELAGIIKLISTSEGKLLGAHIACAHATDMIAELGLALELGASVNDIANTIHAHPTLSEGIFEASLHLIEK